MPNRRSDASTESTLEVLGEAPGVFRSTMFDQIAITVWLGRLDAKSASVLAQVTRDTMKRLGNQRASSIHMINPRVKLPDADARSALVEIMQESGASVACVAIIVEGSGFWASALRGFITSVRVLGPRSYNLHEHGSIAEVVKWLPAEHFKHTGKHVDAGVLERNLFAARAWQDQAIYALSD
jgi:hypothetical protein